MTFSVSLYMAICHLT